ncbi:MAG: tRNA dimethylallyltransferase [Acidimicrobiales bacterium AG-410-I20]|nr:MAG: tRNA dimethylallyltransferase [Acidimicrobiales bacterium AG-410-I20]
MDSMAIYKGMNIGTATPSEQEQKEVRHHLINIAEPTEEFSVSQFQEAAKNSLTNIEKRGQKALLVGGTGLHVRAVVDNLTIPGQFPKVQRELESEGDSSKLYARLKELDPTAANKMEPTNRRRIIRALEVTIGAEKPFSEFGPGMDSYPPTPFTQIGIYLSRDSIDERIFKRYTKQIDEGFLEEVEQIMNGGVSRTAAPALGYSEFYSYLCGECSFEEAMEKAVIATRRFARRQERWFRRDPRITWFEVEQDSLEVIGPVLKIFDEINKI